MRTVLRRIFFILFSCLVLFPFNAWADTHLTFQNRGTYYEGIKPKPVSGFDIELISVLADYREPAPSLPEELKIQFHLPEDTEVHLTVRELDYRQFYWLDQVTPVTSWAEGFGNIFTWATGPVLQDLDPNMNRYDLGVLARLGHPTPSSVEHIAPVIFYHTSLPITVNGYWLR